LLFRVSVRWAHDVRRRDLDRCLALARRRRGRALLDVRGDAAEGRFQLLFVPDVGDVRVVLVVVVVLVSDLRRNRELVVFFV